MTVVKQNLKGCLLDFPSQELTFPIFPTPHEVNLNTNTCRYAGLYSRNFLTPVRTRIPYQRHFTVKWTSLFNWQLTCLSGWGTSIRCLGLRQSSPSCWSIVWPHPNPSLSSHPPPPVHRKWGICVRHPGHLCSRGLVLLIVCDLKKNNLVM